MHGTFNREGGKADMKEKYFEALVDKLGFTDIACDRFLTYLFSDKEEFPSYQEMANIYEVSKQAIQQTVKSCADRFYAEYKDTDSWVKLISPIEKCLDNFEGSISLKQLVIIGETEFNRDAIDLVRTLHLVQIVSRTVRINKWSEEFEQDNTLAMLEHLEDATVTAVVTYKNNKPIVHRFDETEKKATVADNLKVQFSEKQNILLDEFLSQNASISDFILSSFCKVKSIDLYSETIKINNIFNCNYGIDIIEYNRDENNWEIKSEAYPYLINQAKEYKGSDNDNNSCNERKTIKGVGVVDELMEETLLVNDIEEHSSNSTIVSENKIVKNNEQRKRGSQKLPIIEFKKIFEAQKIMLKNTLSNSNNSYKFYWGIALVTLSSRGIKNANMKTMASLMCAAAWKDVLVDCYTYKENDYMPEFVRRVFQSASIRIHESFDSVATKVEGFVTSEDETRLSRYVPIHFNAGFNDNEYSEIPYLYQYGTNDVTEIFQYSTLELYELKNIIETMKKQYFRNLRHMKETYNV